MAASRDPKRARGSSGTPAAAGCSPVMGRLQRGRGKGLAARTGGVQSPFGSRTWGGQRGAGRTIETRGCANKADGVLDPSSEAWKTQESELDSLAMIPARGG